MPRKDKFHDIVVHALVKDGWTITHDPYSIRFGKQTLFVDLGAEESLTAEKNGRRIAVEVKNFLAKREMAEFERALGQFVLYRSLLKRIEPERTVYLAISFAAYDEFFTIKQGTDLMIDEALKLLVFDEINEEIREWID